MKSIWGVDHGEDVTKAFKIPGPGGALSRVARQRGGDLSGGDLLPNASRISKPKDAKNFRQARKAAWNNSITTSRQMNSPKPQRFV